jgi:hypothetical protein
MSVEIIPRDPPPAVPKNPILDKGVTHKVTVWPDGAGWIDEICIEGEHYHSASSHIWGESPIDIVNDPQWRKKLKERGLRAKRR